MIASICSLSAPLSVIAVDGYAVSGPHTMAFPWKYRIVSAGRDITGCHTKIAEPDDDGNGEVGYLSYCCLVTVKYICRYGAS